MFSSKTNLNRTDDVSPRKDEISTTPDLSFQTLKKKKIAIWTYAIIAL